MVVALKVLTGYHRLCMNVLLANWPTSDLISTFYCPLVTKLSVNWTSCYSRIATTDTTTLYRPHTDPRRLHKRLSFSCTLKVIKINLLLKHCACTCSFNLIIHILLYASSAFAWQKQAQRFPSLPLLLLLIKAEKRLTATFFSFKNTRVKQRDSNWLDCRLKLELMLLFLTEV